MKKIIIIVAAVLLLGGGGAAAYMFLLGGGGGDGGGNGKAGEAHAEAPAPVPETPQFLKMDTLSVPVIQDGKVRKYIVLKLTLELPQGGSKTDVTQVMPKLKDVFLSDLYGYLEGRPSNDGVDVRAVKARLQNAADRVLGEGVVDDVLVESAFEKSYKP